MSRLADGHNEWLTDLCGCMEKWSTDIGAPTCFPIFFPRALTCPCGLYGRVESLLENETEIDCCCFKWCLPGVGREGLMWCVCAAACNFCIPFPFSPVFGCLTAYQRWRIMDQFNIDGGCFEVSKGFCYPCALYQQFVFLHELKRQRLYENTSVLDSSLDSGLIPRHTFTSSNSSA